jgi:hypothetical protein
MMDYHEISRVLAAADGPRVAARWAGRLLGEVGAERTCLMGIVHPLGFVCLPVERSGVYGICLHIWDAEFPTAKPDTSEIHCHSWDLVSLVLHGSIVNELIEVADDRESPTHRVFRVTSRDGRDSFTATSRVVRYRQSDHQTRKAGEVYRLPAGHFHKTVVPEGWAAATIALGEEHPGGRDLSLGVLSGAMATSTRRELAPEQTSRLARRWAKIISRG